jgi:hypothetical protein
MRYNELNLSELPYELRFLLSIVGNKDEAYLGNQTHQNINWTLFLELVLHHRLFPGLEAKLMRLNQNYFPSDVLKRLQDLQQFNTFKMLHLTAEMIKINQFFVDNKIRTLFLKGPFLAEILYGDLSLRTSSDLDILVSMKDLEVVEGLLLQMGYVKDDYIQTILNDWKWRHHHFAFYHPKTKVKVEVHWRLNPGPGKEPSFEKLWSNKKELNILDSSLFYLGNEDLFFFLVSHGARHGWSRLRWLMDIHQLLSKPLKWGVIRQLFNTYHNLSTAGQALILVNQLLGTSIEKPIKILGINLQKSFSLAEEALFYIKQMISLHTQPLPDNVSKYHKQHLVHLMSTHQKSLFFLSFLFPYPEDADVIPLPEKFHFLYFVLRPFLWIWRKQKKVLNQGVRE